MHDNAKTSEPIAPTRPRVLLAWPEGRGPLLAGQPARCRVAGQARGHYAFA